MPVICIANQKGGVGKTTTAAALAQVAYVQAQPGNFAQDVGTANALTITLTPNPGAYIAIKGAPIRVDGVAVGIGGGRQVDLGAVDMQQAAGPAGGQRGGLRGVDDVVGHAGHLGSVPGHRDQSLKGADTHAGRHSDRATNPRQAG